MCYYAQCAYAALCASDTMRSYAAMPPRPSCRPCARATTEYARLARRAMMNLLE